MITHPIPPLFNEDSEILILGSFPSVKSREVGFFYGHKQNRFWKVISALCGVPVVQTIEEKTELVLSHKIALWDVIASCEIKGSADSSVTNAVPNDLSIILDNSNIKRIFTNGRTAYNLYNKHIKEKTGIEAVYLPSTSPANASKSLDKLCEEWKIIFEK